MNGHGKDTYAISLNKYFVCDLWCILYWHLRYILFQMCKVVTHIKFSRTTGKSQLKLSFASKQYSEGLKVHLDVGTKTEFIIGCIVNSFVLSLEISRLWTQRKIKGINNTSDSDLGSRACMSKRTFSFAKRANCFLILSEASIKKIYSSGKNYINNNNNILRYIIWI